MKYLFAALLLLTLGGCATVSPVSHAATAQPVGALRHAAVPGETFAWPIDGPIISYFGADSHNRLNKGIDIRAAEGSTVKAARSGTVVFLSDAFKGYGKTLIVDHGDNYQTVYAYNDRITVKTGDFVSRNQTIAMAGRTGRAVGPSLHFEIRKNGEPKNPLDYLSR